MCECVCVLCRVVRLPCCLTRGEYCCSTDSSADDGDDHILCPGHFQERGNHFQGVVGLPSDGYGGGGGGGGL